MAIYLFIGNIIALIGNKDDGTTGGLSVMMIIASAVFLGFQIFCLIVMIRCYRFLRNQRRRMAEMNLSGIPTAGRPSSVPAWQVAKAPTRPSSQDG